MTDPDTLAREIVESPKFFVRGVLDNNNGREDIVRQIVEGFRTYAAEKVAEEIAKVADAAHRTDQAEAERDEAALVLEPFAASATAFEREGATAETVTVPTLTHLRAARDFLAKLANKDHTQ